MPTRTEIKRLEEAQKKYNKRMEYRHVPHVPIILSVPLDIKKKRMYERLADDWRMEEKAKMIEQKRKRGKNVR